MGVMVEERPKSGEASDYHARVLQAFKYLHGRISTPVRIGIVLGSGLGAVADELHEKEVLPYQEIPGFPARTVEGHRGELVSGLLSGKRVILFNGRFHYYQGYSLQDVTLSMRVAHKLGVESFIITNACGGINRSFRPGDIMLIKDHINLMGSNPLIGLDAKIFGQPFVDMSNAYDAYLRSRVAAMASSNPAVGELREGVYLGVSGPSYETEAEISFFRKIGADAVGMSTIPEVIVCSQLGIRVVGLSVVANLAVGMEKGGLSHGAVLDVTMRASRRLGILIKDIVEHVL